MATDLDYAALSSVLSYNPDTGDLSWLIAPPFSKLKAGSVAGWVSGNGRRYVKINRKTYTASRIAWVLHNKTPIPNGMQVDHKNLDRDDNRIDNLRLATGPENLWNRRGNGASGLKGVSLHKPSGLWVSAIKANKTRHHLGYFKTPEEAHEAYKAAAIKLHGEYAKP